MTFIKTATIGLIFIAISCRSFDYSESSFQVENDPNIHNAQLSVTFPVEQSTEAIDRRQVQRSQSNMLRRFGLTPASATPFLATKEHVGHGIEIVAWFGLQKSFSTDEYLHQSAGATRYRWKKLGSSGKNYAHAVFEHQDSLVVGIIFRYAPQDALLVEEYLQRRAGIFRAFFPDKTSSTCNSEALDGIAVEFPREHVRDDFTLLKFYRIEEDSTSLEVYTLRQPNELPYSGFKVCPGLYRVVYSDLQHRELWADTIRSTPLN